ncbi:MAG TPA: iron-sulfur cluster assembly scaffold protein [Blastocatellia bacterium]|nr:iron-sulfur cluster assembly scaffold protein [Blastocatellia bacterium]
MYTSQVAEHIANPRNVGEIENPSGVGDVTNQVCLDRMRLTIRIEEDRLVDAKIKAKGCPPTIAAASALTELIIGRTLYELEAMSRRDIIGALGRLPPAKEHCAVLAIEALRAAIDDSKNKK